MLKGELVWGFVTLHVSEFKSKLVHKRKQYRGDKTFLNPIAIRTAKLYEGFGRSECNRVKIATVTSNLKHELIWGTVTSNCTYVKLYQNQLI